jgi:hypothetical protein
MCAVLLPLGDNPIAVNKYIISYQLISDTTVYQLGIIIIIIIIIIMGIQPFGRFGRNQSPVRRLVWLRYAASWASS